MPKGYYWHAPRGKYQAKLVRHGQPYYFGYHDTKEQARAAYLEGRELVRNSENDQPTEINGEHTTEQNAAALRAWFIQQGRMDRHTDLRTHLWGTR